LGKFAIIKCLYTYDKNSKDIPNLRNKLENFLNGFPTQIPTSNLLQTNFQPFSNKKYFAVPTQVNYVSKSFPTNIAYSNPDSPVLMLLTKIVSLNYLHNEIREKGGAYGSNVSSGGGLLTFSTYRDPHVDRSIEKMSSKNILDWLASPAFTQLEIDQAKLKTFASLDTPIAPSKKSVYQWEHDVSNELLQKRRDQIFNATKDDLLKVAEKYFVLNEDHLSSYAVVGNDQTTDVAIKSGFTVVQE